MKTNKTDESREIGELISEITENGFSGIEIDFDDSGLNYHRVSIHANCRDHITQFAASGHSLVETLREMCDDIREYIGKPSLQEELESMLVADAEHATLPPIITGPDARCRCGSCEPLVIERKLFLRASWQMGTVYFSGDLNNYPAHSLLGLEVPLLPGEILTCQDCGKNYSLGERQN